MSGSSAGQQFICRYERRHAAAVRVQANRRPYRRQKNTDKRAEAWRRGARSDCSSQLFQSNKGGAQQTHIHRREELGGGGQKEAQRQELTRSAINRTAAAAAAGPQPFSSLALSLECFSAFFPSLFSPPPHPPIRFKSVQGKQPTGSRTSPSAAL